MNGGEFNPEVQRLEAENDRLEDLLEKAEDRISELEMEVERLDDEAVLTNTNINLLRDIAQERHDFVCSTLPSDTTGTGEYRYKHPIHCCHDPLCRLAVSILNIRGDGNR